MTDGSGPAILVVLLAGGILSIATGWCVVRTWRRSLRREAVVVAAWSLSFVAMGVLGLLNGRPDAHPVWDVLLGVSLCAFAIAYVAIVRRFFDAWRELTLDAWLIGGSVFLASWSIVLLTGNDVTLEQPYLDLVHVSVAAWLTAGVLRHAPLLEHHSRPVRLAAVTFPLPYLAAVVLQKAPMLNWSEEWLDLPELLTAASFGLILVVVAAYPDGLPHDVVPLRSRVGQQVPYLAVLLALPLALTAILSGDAGGMAAFLALCGLLVIVLSIRQILTTDVNEALVSRMREREDLYRSLVQDSSDVIMIATHEGVLEYVSPAASQVLGEPGRDMVGRPAGEVLGVTVADVQQVIDLVLTGGAPQRIESRTVGPTDSTYLETIVSIRGSNMVLNVRDVSERTVLREQLNDLAFRDPLTGLHNRTRLLRSLEQSLDSWRGDPPGAQLVLLFLDLDGFKAVNDAAGHAAGDAVLRKVAGRLAAALPSTATLARVGGDEFAVLFTDISREDAGALADHIADEVSRVYQIDQGEFVIGVSIGVVEAVDAADAENLLRDADLAMYAAKRSRQSWMLFDPSMHEEAVRRTDSDRLHADALSEGRLELRYQPIVDLETETPTGVEALLRWRTAVGTLCPPQPLIEYAERTGRVSELTDWVIGTALDQVAAWRDEVALIPVSVNLAPVELLREGAVASLRRELMSRDLPACVLTIEITEQVLLREADRAIRVIGDLRALGIKVAIDDFGTGFSSLAYLVDLPVDVIKLDASFLHALPRTHTARVVVAGIVEMARDLDLVVVAEGVETVEQRDLLLTLGRTQCQGYLFGGALRSDEVRELFTSGDAPVQLQHRRAADRSA
ncbi:MAG: EAL domain-containing protein [Actinomycetota bacterium]|nr:EAL domain-containing protein [Actinomycetota bacterium]